MATLKVVITVLLLLLLLFLSQQLYPFITQAIKQIARLCNLQLIDGDRRPANATLKPRAC